MTLQDIYPTQASTWFQQNAPPVGPQPAVQPTYQRLPAGPLPPQTSAPPPQGMPPAYQGAPIQDPRAAIMPILQRYPAGPEGLRRAWPEIQRMFPGAVLEDSDEFVIPGYGRVDVGRAFEGGDPSRMAWVWQHGNRGNVGNFQMGTFTGGGRYPLASVMGPGLMQPWTTPFNRRSPEEIAKDPAFKFQLGEGIDAIQRSASAKGTLLTGGTLKALDEWAQGLAHTYDDKYYNRDLGEYQMAHDIYGQNQQNQFNRLGSLAGVGQTAAGNLAQSGSQYGQDAGNMMGNIGAAQAAGRVGSANAWSGALGNLGNFGAQLPFYWQMMQQNQPTNYGGFGSTYF